MYPRNIQSYDNYRSFLKDVFLNEKVSSEGVTLAKFAKCFDMSASAFKMLLDGSRNLTVHNIHRIAEALRLDETSHQFFECMVLRDQAENIHESEYYERRIKKLKDVASPAVAVRLAANKLLSRWFLPALLIYLIDVEKIAGKGSLDNIDIDVEKIARCFQVDASLITAALKNFEDLGLLQATTDEKLHFVFEKVTSSYPQRQFIKEVFAEGLRRVESEFDSSTTFFKAYTFSLAHSEIANLRDDYKALIERYMAQTPRPGEPLEVLQANCQIFPVVHSSP